MLVSIIAILVGVLIFLCTILIRHFLINGKQKQLDKIIGKAEATAAASYKSSRVNIGKKLKDSGADQPYKKGSLHDLIQQAGFTTSLPRFWCYSLICAFVVFLLCLLFHTSLVAKILFPVIGLLGLPKVFLKIKAGRRQKRFLEEFPDALDAMVRLLKAGMPVTEAIAMASREFEGPVGVEMTYLYEQQRVGVSLTDAAERCAMHIPIPEAQMFATALAIQSETGSSLSEVLTNLSGVIRARFKLKRKVVALSSEARASAMIIGSLPICVGMLLKIVNPEYMSLLFEDRTGNVLLWGCGIWMSIGILVMRQMINFRV
jgi:tight adherence protein B